MAKSNVLDPLANADYAKYGFRDPEKFVYKSEKGLSQQLIQQISAMKEELEWLLNPRLKTDLSVKAGDI